MAETSPNSAEFFSAGDHHQTDRPRKRPRKGTKSCWECKRRKVRCILAAPGDAVCNECRRRGTACVGQDLPDPPQGSGSSQRRAVEDRLGRLEALVETLVEHLVSKTSTSGAGNPRDSSCPSPRDIPICRERELGDRRGSLPLPSPRPPLSPATGLAPILALQNGPSSKYDRLSQRLSAAWPDQHDLDLFLDGLDDMGTLGYQLYKAGCLPCDGAVPPRGILRLPPPGSHPILMARKLLLLSMVLQGAMLHPAQEATGATNKPKWHGIMSRVVDAAGLVTVNDELAGCVEGVECLFMESMYHDAVGSLHRASLAIRRAVTMAQMLGLHRGSSITGMAPHSDSGEVDVRQLWFRLVQADRYISFVLGLPQGFCVDDVFATPQALEASPPAERMRRLDVVAAGLILQRKASDMHNTGATLEIDKLLQQSAAGLPSQWWRPVNLAVFRPGHDSPGVLDEVMRIMDQLVHFHLLAQLHLPYLLHPAVNAEDSNNNNNNNQSMYNKLTAINACRDLLTRFISFHQAADSSIAHYCRGASLLAFIAASTLCLAHLEASSRPYHADKDAGPGDHYYHLHGSLAFLVHQRPSDRSLMEQAAAGLQEVHVVGGVTRARAQDTHTHTHTAAAAADVAVPGIMGILLGQLLAMEEDAAHQGGRYVTSFLCPSSPTWTGDGVGVGEASEDGASLRIFIPQFGGVEVKRVAPDSEREGQCQLADPDDGADESEWALHACGVDMAFESLVQGLDEPGGGITELWTGE